MSKKKRCGHCHQMKPVTEFNRKRTTKDGLQSNCKACLYDYAVRNREKIRLARRKWRVEHREERREWERAWREANREWLKQETAARHLANREYNNARSRAYHAANKERLNEAHKKWVAEHRDEVRERQRRWYDEHAEMLRERTRQWVTDNPERHAINQARHVAKRRALAFDAFIEHVDRALVWDRDEGICQLCGGAADPLQWHLDHLTPLTRGGEHSYANVVVAHPDCNQRKSALTYQEWLRRRPL